MKQTETSIWANGSIVDIQQEIREKEKRWASVRQIALDMDSQWQGSEPHYTGFIVYEWDVSP